MELTSPDVDSIIFVTRLPVTFFLTCPETGLFYLFFMKLDDFFVTVLCQAVNMRLRAR